MGDRAHVLFFDDSIVSPMIYLHWHGSYIPQWLDELKALMATRRRDAAYAAARFAGLCHTYIPGNLSLGITSTHLRLANLSDTRLLEQMSPADAGIVVVDTADFTWRAYGGYLAHPINPTERTNP